MTGYNLIPSEGHWNQAVALAAPAGGKDEWREYRQKLRNITDGVTDHNAAGWPISPKDKA